MQTRREFLRTGALGVLGAAAVACGGGAKTTDGGATTNPDSLDALIAGRAQTLAPVIPGALSRANERIPVVLQAPQDPSTFFRGGGGKLWIAESRTAKALGPFALTWHDEGLTGGDEPGPHGTYSARVSVPRDGVWLVLVEATPEGSSASLLGGGQFAAGRRSEQPIPGEKAISVPTPTPSDHRGVEPYCTHKPKPCTMHTVSLDAALANGKPTVLIIATPAFCQSKTCGPEVDAVEIVHREMQATHNFVHIEVYADDTDAPAKGILAPAAVAWKLDEEPAIYFIAPDGTIADRFIGLAAADEIRDAAAALS